MRRALLAVWVVSTACATTSFVPRPFTAEQIREATKPGTTWTYEVHQANKPPIRQITNVEHADTSIARFAQTSFTVGGQVIGATTTSTATWAELEAHATFDRASTTIEEIVIETPAGEFDGWVYTIVDSKIPREKKLYFAKAMPGAPVRYEQFDAGQLVFSMILVDYR